MPNVKTDLREIAARLPTGASYEDAIYELYVRMKIQSGRKAATEGRVLSHAEVKRRFSKR